MIEPTAYRLQPAPSGFVSVQRGTRSNEDHPVYSRRTCPAVDREHADDGTIRVAEAERRDASVSVRTCR